MYRNKEFYLMMLKGKKMDWAYRYITENLKRPSFAYEPRNAYEAYKEVFGVEFSSPEEMRAMSDKERIAKLEAALEAERAKAKQVDRAAMGQSEIGPNPDGFEIPEADADEAPALLTKEQFTEQFIRENGADKPLVRGRAWKKYCKENGIVEE